MSYRLTTLCAILAVVPALCSAQQPTPPSDPYRDEPAVFEHLDSTVHMNADGTGTTTTHVVLRVQSEGMARQFSVVAVSYASANETGSFDYVRVHKPDGSTVETTVADSIEMPSEVTREAPVYSDIREKHLPIRSLSVGDRLEYQFHQVRTSAEAPGQFWGAQHFALDGVILSQTLTLQVPEKTYVQVWSPNHPAAPVTKDGIKTWTWTSSQTRPSTRDVNNKMTAADIKDPDEDADGRKLPSIAWTTFHNWAQVGDWYRNLALQRAEPTNAIKTKAADLTKDAKTPEEQVQALYRFVATQTRYVGISLGVGRYQPHAAADVLSNQYGDCKDKDTLLEALLRAKGFTTAPALIGAGIALVPDVPTPAVFNHVITTVQLPGSAAPIWLDTTAEVAPYRVLVPVIRDQQALVIPADGNASLQKTPADPPYPYKERFESVGTLSDQDVLKSHVQMTVRSDAELGYRAVLRQSAPAQWDQLMQNVAAAMNLGGKVSNADLRQADTGAPVHVGFDYTREEYGNWKSNRIWANMPALEITYIDKEKQPEHDIDLGAPRTLEAESIITVPVGDRIELPVARHVQRPYTSYDETYRFVDGKFIGERVVVVKQHKLSKDQWKDYLAFVKEAGLDDSMQEATLILPLKDGTSSGTASAEGSIALDVEKASSRQLKDASVASQRRGDWVAARRYAEKVVARFPEDAYTHSMLAFVDAHDKRYDEAAVGYKAELAAHPNDSSDVVRLLAGVYLTQKKFSEAIDLLQQYSSRNDKAIFSMLIGAKVQNHDWEGALNTVQKQIALSPTDRPLQTMAVGLLKDMHRYAEATEAAKAALDGADDPNLINSNAYFLAEMKSDLPFAEEQSRKSIDLFARATANAAIEEANTQAFANSAQMVAAWDTLGYIYLLEEKAREAEPYLYAAWFNAPDVVKGDHLALAYEAQGKKGEALRMFRLALATEYAANAKEEFAEATEHAEELEHAGVKPSGGSTQVLDVRTFHITKAANSQGGGTVRVQVNSSGVAAAVLVSGGEQLKAELEPVKQLTMRGAVPPGSQARVLRDAVIYCGKTSSTCDFVFMTSSGINREGATE